jgi:hypothetical protein
MTGYTKLFGSIVHSTIWREATPTRIVWITLLALKDGRGDVHASVPGLADAARVTRSECEEALDRLCAPDPDSSNREEEGRRIIPIEGGWFVVSHQKYSRMLSVEERRERDAARKRVQRQSATVRDVTDVAESLPSRSILDPDPELTPVAPVGAVAKKPRKRNQKGPLPIDWAPTKNHIAYAIENGLDINAEVKAFRLWADGQERDNWNGTFSTRLSNSVAYGRGTKATPGKVRERSAADVLKDFR